MSLGSRSWPADPLLRRRIVLDRQLASLLEDPDATIEEIRPVVELHAQVAKRLQARRRRRSLRWFLTLAAAGLILTAVFSRWRLKSPGIVLAASTSALVFGVGPDDQELARSVPLIQLSYDGSGGSLHLCQEGHATNGCMTKNELWLESLTAFAGGQIRLSRQDACTEVTFLQGGGMLEVAAAGRFEADRFSRIGPLETLRFCGSQASHVTLRAPSFMIVGDATPEPENTRALLPAISEGSIVLAKSDRTWDLRRTDIVRLLQLKNAVASVWIRDEVELSLAGRVGKIELIRATSSEDVTPTLLDFLLGSVAMKSWYSLIAGILTALTLLRGKIEELLPT